MTRPSLRAAAVMAAVSALLLSGCAPSDGPTATSQSATATPKPTPMFASDEEALKAATEVYRKLITTEFAMYRTGVWDGSALAPYATKVYLADSENQLRDFVASGNHTSGNVRIVRSSIQRIQLSGDEPSATIYVCSDVSALRTLDAAGADVTPASRKDMASLLVTLKPEGATLKVDESAAWSGQSVC